MNKDHRYIGSELNLFALALNWKAYIKQQIGHYIQGHVLEVGAGIGETTKVLMSGHEASWTCLEPDRRLAEKIALTLENGYCTQNLRLSIVGGDIDHPACDREFDTILYIDVLEHIENDQIAIEIASRKLKKNGFLIVLSPAHPYLYSPFDAKIGHYRRYNRKRFKALTPVNTEVIRIRYLDCAGCLASLGNKVLLKAGMPSKNQIIIWDRLMVPISRVFDSVLGYRVGKSVYSVWQKNL